MASLTADVNQPRVTLAAKILMHLTKEKLFADRSTLNLPSKSTPVTKYGFFFYKHPKIKLFLNVTEPKCQWSPRPSSFFPFLRPLRQWLRIKFLHVVTYGIKFRKDKEKLPNNCKHFCGFFLSLSCFLLFPSLPSFLPSFFLSLSVSFHFTVIHSQRYMLISYMSVYVHFCAPFLFSGKCPLPCVSMSSPCLSLLSP